MSFKVDDIEQRAAALYQQLQLQRAIPETYEAVRSFVSVRQMDNQQHVDAIARRVWEHCQYMRGEWPWN
jgi:hypothetical protein